MNHRIARAALAGAAAIVLAACDGPTDVPNFNAQGYEDLEGADLSRAEVEQLTFGILDAHRTALAYVGGGLSANYIQFAGTLGRDVYRIDASENRFITEFLANTPDPSAFSGGGAYGAFYRTVVAVNALTRNLPTTTDDNLSDEEKAATRGLANTVKALALYQVLETRDSLGVALDSRGPARGLPPITCKPEALGFLEALLDSAYRDLGRAGDEAFPFRLPSTFDAFDTPAQFAKVNRGLAARVAIYRGLSRQSPDAQGFQRALGALGQSFLDPAGDLGLGVAHAFTAAGGDQTNPLVDANLHANPSVAADANPADRRFQQKLVHLANPISLFGFTTEWDFAHYGSATSPIPVLRNEELILLRAQAHIGLGNLEAARADINVVRTRSGGLAPYAAPFANAAAAITALLYEKRYSLLLEGAHRLVDLRAYDRLRAPYIRVEGAEDPLVAALPIPTNEVNARGGSAACSSELPD